jgi:sigma-B regulation protein RsbU (phosphoserine phosphatase)
MPTSARASDTPSADLLPLFEFSNVINSSLDLKFILGTVLLTVMGKMLVSKGMVLLKKKVHEYQVVTAKGVGGDVEGMTFVVPKSPKRIMTIRRGKNDARAWMSFFRDLGITLIVPIVSQGSVVGFLGLGERLGGRRYSESDLQLINSLVNLSASAIEKALIIGQLKEANRNLDRKFQELNTLFDLGKEFNVVLESDKVIRLLTFSLLGQVGVNRYAICLEEGTEMKVVASRLDGGEGIEQAFKSLQQLKSPEIVQELARKKKFAEAAAFLLQRGIRVVVPMMTQNDVKGFILLGDRLRGGPYTRGDLEFLASLAHLAIISIENARLFREALEKQRLEDELAIAREIQQGLLPRSLPGIEGFDVAAINIPSKQVGGDYYDVVPITPHEVVLAIGDVSGKGTGAALLMANVQASLRAFAPMGMSLSEATARINNLTCQSTGQGKFITFFWGSLNVPQRVFRYVNAGHNPPMLFHADGSLEKLEVGGIILGLMNTITPYQEGMVELRQGDVLVMYTDGVSEAMNAQGEDFTEERLEHLIRSKLSLSARQIIDEIQAALDAYTRGTPQSDDITMLVLKVL